MSVLKRAQAVGSKEDPVQELSLRMPTMATCCCGSRLNSSPVCVGKHLKAGVTDLEGQTFEFITTYDTLASMGQELKSCMSSEVLVKNDLSMWGHVMQGRVSHVTEILLSLVSVNGIIFSINPHWWNWAGEVSPTRVEVKLYNTVRIHVRVVCSAAQLSQFASTLVGLDR